MRNSLALAADAAKRHAAYRALFNEEMDEPLLEAIRDATNGGYPLASDAFKNTVLAPLGWKTAARQARPASEFAP